MCPPKTVDRTNESIDDLAKKLQDFIKAAKGGGINGVAQLILNSTRIKQMYIDDRQGLINDVIAPAYLNREIVFMIDEKAVVYAEHFICYCDKKVFVEMFPSITLSQEPNSNHSK